MRNTKEEKDPPLTFRSFDFGDIEGVLQIANKLTGGERPDYWKKRFSEYLSLEPMDSMVAATEEGRIVGFILGHVRGWEAGLGEKGWIEIFGVDPEYHERGVGSKLLKELIQYFKSRDVKVIYTNVEREETSMQVFLMRNGFTHADIVPLKLDLE